jgi:hypothetical protein
MKSQFRGLSASRHGTSYGLRWVGARTTGPDRGTRSRWSRTGDDDVQKAG